MSAQKFDDLCRSVGLLLALESPGSLHTGGAYLEGEKCWLACSEDFDETIHLYVDAGKAGDVFEEAEIYRTLLICNLGLSPELGESFSLHQQTGHVLLRGSSVVELADARALAARFQEYAHLIRELRKGPLRNLIPPYVEQSSR